MKKFLALLTVAVLIITAAAIASVGCKKEDSNLIRLNEVTHSVFYAPLYAAINLGYFQDEGLEVELTNGGGSDVTMTALVSGSADIALAGPEASVYVYLEGKEDYSMLFAQLTKRDGSFIVGRTDDAFDWDTSLLNKEILGGRKGGMPAMALEYTLKKHGYVDGQNIKINYDVQYNLMIPAFEAGTADFCTMFEPAASNYISANKGHIVASVGEECGGVPFTAFSALKSYIEKNPKKIQAFTNALQKGMDFVKNSTPEVIADAVAESFTGTDKALLVSSIANYKRIDAYKTETTMYEADFNRLLDIIIDAGVINRRADFNALFNNSFAVK